MAFKHTYIASQDGLSKHYAGKPDSECFKTSVLTPTKAIRAKCMECSNYSYQEIKDCDIWYCPLYPFRFGKSGVKKEMTDEQKAAAAERLRAAREK